MKIELTEFKAVIGIWLLAQPFIIPFIIIDTEKFGLIMDFVALVLLIIMYFGLKLIGV